MAEWRRLSSVLVSYASDPVLLHQRVLLMHLVGRRWVVCTPDRDVYEMDLSCPPLVGLYTMGRRGVLEGVDRGGTYLLEDGQGDFTAIELEELDREAKVAARVFWAAQGIDDYTEWRWRVLVTVDGYQRGQELMPGPGDCGRGRFAVVEQGGNQIPVTLVNEKAKEEWMARGPGGEEEDLRVLPVAYDLGSGERFRTVEDAVAMTSNTNFDDWPLEGPRSSLWLRRELRKQGLTFLRRRQNWSVKSGIRDGDRAIHEQGSICRALHYMMTYDQLNLGNLAGVEALAKRMMLLEEAYRGRPSAPSYEGAEHFVGARESMDGNLVDPGLVKHVATKLKEESEVKKEQRKWREEQTHRHGGGGGGSGSSGGGGRGKKLTAPAADGK